MAARLALGISSVIKSFMHGQAVEIEISILLIVLVCYLTDNRNNVVEWSSFCRRMADVGRVSVGFTPKIFQFFFSLITGNSVILLNESEMSKTDWFTPSG